LCNSENSDILYDAIKTIQNGVFVFCFKEQKPVFSKNPKTPGLKKTKNPGGLDFKKRVFLNPYFCAFLLRNSQ